MSRRVPCTCKCTGMVHWMPLTLSICCKCLLRGSHPPPRCQRACQGTPQTEGPWAPLPRIPCKESAVRVLTSVWEVTSSKTNHGIPFYSHFVTPLVPRHAMEASQHAFKRRVLTSVWEVSSLKTNHGVDFYGQFFVAFVRARRGFRARNPR